MKQDFIQQDVDLATKTTINLGGVAKYYAVCNDTEQINTSLEFARKNNLPIQILGGGSNVIFPDSGFSGLVIHPQLAHITPLDQHTINVGAGVVWDKFVAYAVDHNLGGLEQLSGIPGTVGAAPVQNIGAYGIEVSSVIKSVTAINLSDDSTQILTNSECEFSYRLSIFKKNPGRWLITSVTFTFSDDYQPNTTYPSLNDVLPPSADRPSGPALTQLIRAKILELRQSKSMVYDHQDPNSHSCGSFFTNPTFAPEEFKQIKQHISTQGLPEPPYFEANSQIKLPAAWLIEHAGYPRGYRQGQVGISPHHNLALVNYGGTTQDLIDLAKSIQKAVTDKFNIDLQYEPIIIKD